MTALPCIDTILENVSKSNAVADIPAGADSRKLLHRVPFVTIAVPLTPPGSEACSPSALASQARSASEVAGRLFLPFRNDLCRCRSRLVGALASGRPRSLGLDSCLCSRWQAMVASSTDSRLLAHLRLSNHSGLAKCGRTDEEIPKQGQRQAAIHGRGERGQGGFSSCDAILMGECAGFWRQCVFGISRWATAKRATPHQSKKADSFELERATQVLSCSCSSLVYPSHCLRRESEPQSVRARSYKLTKSLR